MSNLLTLIQENRDAILNEWLQAIREVSSRRGLIDDRELETQTSEVLAAIYIVPTETPLNNLDTSAWRPLKDLLANLSASRAIQGFTPSETAMFVLSLRAPLFALIRKHWGNKADQLFAEITVAADFIDKLALHTTDSYIHGRDQVIIRQQEEMLELSTPVVTLWDGIVALPLIGTLDSARTQVVMESLLQAIVQTNSRVAIIDITGVPTVDTLVAQHLLKTITAARLMGADCILSGIRPQIAQTIVHLGINLEEVTTKARLADAFRLALERSGRAVVRVAKNNTVSAVSKEF
ncbi:STAS domain-containing protein [Alloacidobacterium dinghuense]|uniref:STAS domain-containing protein n=1 Tax=Alloacidobacterium dinghuense TaxID=2763107 RepID=A0A7G8BKW3_9BACT|nr:STAS domain-containing protein [Alloacidobacterium dinghuense]QNI33183.1 STAS domain-containing protein [Alloacidobacterium dinghuense]